MSLQYSYLDKIINSHVKSWIKLNRVSIPFKSWAVNSICHEMARLTHPKLYVLSLARCVSCAIMSQIKSTTHYTNYERILKWHKCSFDIVEVAASMDGREVETEKHLHVALPFIVRSMRAPRSTFVFSRWGSVIKSLESAYKRESHKYPMKLR